MVGFVSGRADTFEIGLCEGSRPAPVGVVLFVQEVREEIGAEADVVRLVEVCLHVARRGLEWHQDRAAAPSQEPEYPGAKRLVAHASGSCVGDVFAESAVERAVGLPYVAHVGVRGVLGPWLYQGVDLDLDDGGVLEPTKSLTSGVGSVWRQRLWIQIVVFEKTVVLPN